MWAVSNGCPTRAQVEEQLRCILRHNTLVRSKQLSRPLQVIIEETLRAGSGSLKEVNLAATVYGYTDYDTCERSRVRVDASTLRRKLERYYSTDGVNDLVLIEIPKGGYTASFTYRTRSRMRPSNWTRRVASIGFIGCAAALLLVSAIRWSSKPPIAFELPVQLTFDGGFTSEPSISADGSTLVYASDRGKDGIVHVWVQSGGAPPRQLTEGPSHDFHPELSPDRRLVAFRSLREGDGLFTVPLSGGDPKLLVRGAYSQRFSPDSRSIVYAGNGTWSESHIFVVDPATRSEPRRIDSGVAETACAEWTPDGRHIIFLGKQEPGDWDYWVASIDSSRAASRPLGLQAMLRRRRLPVLHSPYDCPQDWIGNRLLFVISGNEPGSPITDAIRRGNVFEVLLAPGDWLPAATVQVLQPVLHTDMVRVARERNWIVFTAESNTRSVWALTLAAPKPPVLFRAVEEPGIRSGFAGTWPGLSADGKMFCFVTQRSATPGIACKDLISGTERLLGANPSADSKVLPDRDGRRVAFLRTRDQRSDLIVLEISSGAEHAISSECPVLLQWAGDEKSFLCSEGIDVSGPQALYRINSFTGEKTPLIHLKGAPLYAQLSPDGLWLALVANGQNGLLTGNLISLKENPEDTSRWIKVAEERFHLSLHWAPDGASVYYWQVRDGSRSLWGQRLNPRTKQPVGQPFAVLHRHMYQAYPVNGGTLAVAGTPDHLVFAMTLSDNLADLWRVNFQK